MEWLSVSRARRLHLVRTMDQELFRFPRPQLDALIARLARDYRVVGPVRRGGRCAWADVMPGAPVALDYPTTMLPPRQFFAPPRELLFRFRRGADGRFRYDEPEPERPVALLGVHGCDLTGLRVLRSFHESSCRDRVVPGRLDQGFIIGLACWAPCSADAFCRDMGSLESEAPAALYAWDLGEVFLVKVLSARGREVLQDVTPLEAATADELVALRRRLRARHDAFPRHLGFSPERLAATLEAASDDLLWEATADRCLSCGRCNLVCPTCTCFDVGDEATLDGSSGERLRRWTGCQVPGFSKVAGGRDFRPTRAQQLRYRVFRKGKYMPERYGMVGCTGCGRCIGHCPTRISIRDIFRQVGAAP
jgi:sulfhydrogenase subunit beta (sulfur reductase)